MARRSLIYCRISQDREGAGLGVDRQREDCEKLAAALGWTVVDVLTDNDVSAYSGKARPGYRALLGRLQAGDADAVLCWHTDRLHRSPRELEEYVDVCEARGIVTQTVTAGELDLATPSGRAVARTLGVWARFESEHKAERIRRKHEASALAGKWRGGGRPFGWIVDDAGGAVLHPTEAAVVREASTAVLAGASLGSIVRDLNARGVLTARGKPWNYTSLRQVITRPKNAGLSELRGEVVGPSTWPAIVPEGTWRAVCAVLADPTRRRSQSNRAVHLLSGIALCGGGEGGSCGRPLRPSGATSRTKAGVVRRVVYRCETFGPGHVARTADVVDDYVSRVVVERLSRPDVADLLAPRGAGGPDAEALRLEAVALRQRLGEASDQYADGVITAGMLARITDRVQGRLAEVEGALARASRGGVLADFARGRPAGDVWADLTVERRRAVVDALVTVTLVPVRRGKAFNPDGVLVEWRSLVGE